MSLIVIRLYCISWMCAHEIVDIWDVDSAIIEPIVVSANGLIPKSLERHLKRLSLDGWVKDLMQKVVLLDTARIVVVASSCTRVAALRVQTALFYKAVLVSAGSRYSHDFMGREDKQKMMYLATDLVKDSLLKMRQIIDIRREHEVFISFNVGIIIGRIREKYRNIMDIYNDIVNKRKDRSGLQYPGLMNLRPLHHVIALEQIHYLSIEIDKLVDVLEKSATEDLESHDLLVSGFKPPKPMMRMGLNPEEEKKEEEQIQKIAKEEATKSLMRQRYLMKRLGKSPNGTTTMKRFLRQWPVDKTWSLEKYSY